ncbi:hypothetical protein IFM89_017434 [Coptis chinensis]|uniref:Agenet domain-containing protein n=1 Tax=Coptis chinensis TaxID=261450 RepID=A0A835H5W8_9MAGN|nr:hypothetical protein IFM89_017434 [Coptis chinensis]
MGDSEVSLFKVGDEVEVNGDNNEEFKDTWFTAKIIKLTDRKPAKILIQYEVSKYKKFVNPNGIRPLPPPKEANEVFECLQVVDAFYKNGWKKGRIFKLVINKNVRFTVYFPGSNERVDFGAEMLRVHYDWVDSKWRKSLHQELLFQERGIKCDQDELQQTDQPQLLHVGNTALSPDTADESHSRKRKTKNTTPSGDAQLSPPNKKLK